MEKSWLVVNQEKGEERAMKEFNRLKGASAT